MNIKTKTPSDSPYMGRIDTLVHELCPDGVEIQPLGDVCEILRGKRVTKSDIKPQGTYPVISGGITPMGYMEDYNREPNTITVSQYGTAGYVDFQTVRFWANDICYCLYPKQNLNNRYLWYVLKDKQNYLYEIRNTDATPYSLPSETLKSVQIPLPPLAIQQEIVSVLDSFTTLIDKMKQEVEKRKKQMEYYRDMLICEQRFLKKAIGEIGTIKRGSGLQKTDFTEEGTGCIHYGQIYTRLNSFCTETLTFVPTELAKKLTPVSPGDLVIATTSENVEDVCKSVVWLGKEDICTGGHAAVFKHNENPKYISYCFQTGDFFLQKRQYAYGAKVIDIKTEKLNAITLPIPPLSKQREIVSTLDKFESYISKLEKMIVLRQKQYEYYREQLLTFE